jgi:type II secretory pathway predicted ATPase ExeA
MEWVLMAFKLEFRNKSGAELFQVFEEYLRSQSDQGKSVILIVDEAQNMPMKTLEELRVLSNINVDNKQLLQLIIVGQPELRQTLRRVDMMQFAQRVSVDYHLGRLNEHDINEYIEHRLVIAGGEADLFTSDAKKLIARFCKGIPRIINTLCDTAMVYAYAEGINPVSTKIVEQVLLDRMGKSLLPVGYTPVHESVRNIAKP